MSADAAANDHARSTQPSVRTYALVFLALLALLAATVGAAFVPWPHDLGLAIALSVALVKGLLIVCYFMHVKYSDRMVWAFATAGFVWLAILFVLMLSDYLTRGFPR